MKHPLRAYVADALTLGNGVCGFLAILTLSVELGQFSSIPDAYVAAAYIGLGMVADGLDGIVARRWGSTGLGGSLDLMSDAITFTVAPAVLLLELQGAQEPLATSIVATMVLVFGMLRLARTERAGPTEAFIGLPAPWSGGTIAAVALAQTQLGWSVWVPIGVAGVLAALNISRVPYPKTRGPALTRLVLAILVTAAAIIVALVAFPASATYVLPAGLAIAAAMVILGPIVVQRRQRAR